MHILFITRELPVARRNGGIGSYTWDTAHKLVEQGHKVSIITADDRTLKEYGKTIDSIDVFYLPFADFQIQKDRRFSKWVVLISKIRSLLCFFPYRKAIRKKVMQINETNKLDIIETADYGDEAHCLLHDLKRNIPITIRLHGPSVFDRKTCSPISIFRMIRLFFSPYFELKSCLLADSISSPSQNLIDFMKQNYSEFRSRSFHLIPNFIQLEDWEKTAVPENKIFTVVFAGTLVPAKGVEELFAAVERLRMERGIKIRLILVGKSGISTNHILNRIREKKYDWVDMPGAVDRKKLASYFSAADCVCLPSWWENCSMVVLEAMRVNGCVIVSSCGGGKEIIEDGIDGFLVPPQNVSAIADAILKVMSLSQDQRDVIVRNADEKIRKIYSSNAVIPQLESFYEETIRKFQRKKNENRMG